MTRTGTRTPAVSKPPHSLSRPHDAAERQADKAADVVARGGSVTSWSFASVPEAAPGGHVHREDKPGAPKTEEEKYKEAATETAKAALKTPAGQKIVEAVQDDPLVKAATKIATSPVGIGVGVGLGVGGVSALAATGKPLPFQPPAIPLDKITPGLSAQLTYEGPVNAPTKVGLTLSYSEQGPKPKPGGPTAGDRYRAETDRMAADQAKFRAGLRTPAEVQQDKSEQEAIARYVASRSSLPGVGRPLIPLGPGGPIETAAPKSEAESSAPQREQKKTDDAPVQREPASTTTAPDASYDTGRVDAARRGTGRALDPSVRRSMEARFGYDFSRVRIHDDATANSAAADVHASAFTVGDDLIFAPGAYDPSSPAGRHLLAHELAHVVQQSGHGAPVLHRRSTFESIGILLGLEEGNWTDQELHAYLDSVTASGHIEGAYDADNKARAIVRRWKQGSPGYDLLGPQKVLLVKEMLDGPTLGEDEAAILDLLELSDAGDLRTMFGADGLHLADLESDLNGESRTRLDAFVASRFNGGRDALNAGRVVVSGPPVPSGAPVHAFDAATLDARFDSDRTPDELIALIDQMSEPDQTAALHHLSQVRRPRLQERHENLARRSRAESHPERRAALDRRAEALTAESLKTERVLLHYFREAVPATEADLRSSTTPTDPSRQQELRDALRPATAGHNFRPQIPGETQTYEAKLRTHLPILINEYYARIVTGRGPRTHTLSEYEAIGNISKRETDAVFGQFYPGSAHPAIRADTPRRPGNIHDAFASQRRDQAAMDPGQRRNAAIAMLHYLFSSDDWVLDLNHQHDASPEFDDQSRAQNDEARVLDRIARDFTRSPANVRRVNEIERSWDAFAIGREIFVQLFRPADPTEDRLLLWDMFQTLIHEYIHTLSNAAYDTYAESFGTNSPANNTLVEGVDCVLSETVWESVEPRVTDSALRTGVEGATNAALPAIDVPHPSMRRYPSYTEALHLVDLTGITNLYAAYFLGLVDRIGGPAPRAGGRGGRP